MVAYCTGFASDRGGSLASRFPYGMGPVKKPCTAFPTIGAGRINPETAPAELTEATSTFPGFVTPANQVAAYL